MSRLKTRIPYTRPSITESEIELANDAVRNGWGSRCYEYIQKFESDFAKYLGARFSVSTSSCTGAIHLGLAALGIQSGDEVILADTNWIATVSPIVHLGARPVFVDILPDTWCLDPELVEKAITPRTKAIVAVHLYGNVCDMDRLLAIGLKHGIPVIEDAAEALGSAWKGRAAGSMGTFGVFSFHGSKTMTTGEGGMFVTNDEELFKKVTVLSNHGRSPTQKKQFWPEMVGFKYKISNVQAAIGVAQLKRIELLVDRKRAILDYYKQNLAGLKGLSLNYEDVNSKNGAWMPTVVFEKSLGITREKLQAAFATEHIDARVFFWPLSSLPMFETVNQNKIAYDIPERAINLPSFHDVRPEELDRVIQVIKSIYSDAELSEFAHS